MPLPLPNLDTRRWTDLVSEGQAQIPRYAPAWTDHNVHDPGIMLMELLAWVVEQEIYRVNRVPQSHRRKFLSLAGFPPAPPQGARTTLSFTPAAAADPQTLPAGLTVAARDGSGQTFPFRTVAELSVVPAAIAAVQVFDGADFLNQTRLWRDGLPFPLFGPDPDSAEDAAPEAQPALYVGLDRELEAGTSLTLWFWLHDAPSDALEQERLRQEAAEMQELCAPLRPQGTCETDEDGTEETPAGGAPTGEGLPPHHTLRTIWEFMTTGGWQALDAAAGAVMDETRGFTLDGPVRITLPANMEASTVGSDARAGGEPTFYLRCRLASGRPDAAPLLGGMTINTVAARQQSPARSVFIVAPSVAPPPGREPAPGTWQMLHVVLLDGDGVITELAAGPDEAGPEVFVLDYVAATATQPGELAVTLSLVGWGTGLPHQQLLLVGAPVAGAAAEIWLSTANGLEAWRQQPDFDASQRTDAHFTLDATTGTVRFGDGEHGRVAPAGRTILARYESTAGAAANVPAGAAWSLLGADDALNEALLGDDVASLDSALGGIANLRAAIGGADEEMLLHAAGRAAQALWAHERLVELCPGGACATLDQLDRATVLDRTAPARAVTLLDYERLALDAPGVRVSRTRAWAGIDAGLPCFSAPGTVTVVILPFLPRGRPQPTMGLLATVYRYLNRRRIVGTRLLVVGPDYLEVRVLASVRARTGANTARVQGDIVSALNTFLDPLQGGPAGRGWPFGRDVYRAEILQVIDGISGVDHVLSLELVAGEGEAQCGNLCLGPTSLVTPAEHKIEVVTVAQ